jgi:hypothetical protein
MIRLALYIHNHQPVGNFDHVFDYAYTHSYKPLLESLLRHPAVKFGIHNSGPLCEWIEKNRPEYFEMLKTAVSSGQAEIITSAYSEPILSLIPRRDLVDQIRYFTDYLSKKLNCQPKGLWLTERVWEPSLIPALLDAGVVYTMLDDTHFRYAGATDDNLSGYFVTEEEGRVLKVVPISMKLRYLIPFHQVDETVDYLRDEERLRPGSLKCLGDDGEKFGVWPGTHQWVYGHNWLEIFLTRLEKETWIQTSHLGDIVHEQPAGRIYLPTASYEEMGEWVLPQKAGRDYHELKRMVDKKYFYLVHGGYFKNFLSKYPEANLMHKRMIYVSSHADDSLETRRALWRGQCSCAYWHGIFGGLYLPHLREGIYRNLIEADSAVIREDIRMTDFDADGQEELLISTKRFFCLVRPRTGSFIEIDDRQRKVNILNYLGRRRETYHQNLPATGDSGEVRSIHEVVRSKEKNIAQYLIYDSYERGFGLDHGFKEPPTAQDFYQQNESAAGILTYRQFEIADDQVYQAVFASDRLEKSVLVSRDQPVIKLQYKGTVECLGVEFSLGLFNPGLKINDRHPLHELQTLEGIGRFDINGDGLAPLTFAASVPFNLLSYPIETISSSEAGYEKNFQGVCFMLLFRSPPDIEIKL